MSGERFLTPRMTGARFEEGGIPLEVLKDLAVLEEMIVEVAKAEFFKANPRRKRAPRGFAEDIELQLNDIQPGSTVLGIELAHSSPTFFPPNHEYFERARKAIVEAIGAAEEDRPVTDYLEEKTLSYFDRMGRSLRDSEAIELAAPDHPNPVKLTRETRRKLVLASSKVNVFTEEHTVRGGIPEADQDRLTFTLQLINGRRISAPITEQHLDTILEAFNGYKAGVRIWLQGIAQFSRSERLEKFETVGHISILDPLDVPARLEELRSLQDGWLEGEGRAPSHEGLDWIAKAFTQHYPDDLCLPHVYPTPEGGIQAEWSLESNEVTLEMDLAAHTGEWHVVNLAGDTEQSRVLNLDDVNDWKWLINQIRQMPGGAE
ncbi:MAG: hypothetical protein ACLFU6_13965 [Candidatus Hydrogenedentota bacterium]